MPAQSSKDYSLTKLLNLDIEKTLRTLEAEIPTSKLNLGLVSRMILKYREAMKEIDDYGTFLDMVSQVYMYATGDVVSKPHTTVDGMKAAIDDHVNDVCDDWYDEKMEDKIALEIDDAAVIVAFMAKSKTLRKDEQEMLDKLNKFINDQAAHAAEQAQWYDDIKAKEEATIQ